VCYITSPPYPKLDNSYVLELQGAALYCFRFCLPRPKKLSAGKETIGCTWGYCYLHAGKGVSSQPSDCLKGDAWKVIEDHYEQETIYMANYVDDNTFNLLR